MLVAILDLTIIARDREIVTRATAADQVMEMLVAILDPIIIVQDREIVTRTTVADQVMEMQVAILDPTIMEQDRETATRAAVADQVMEMQVATQDQALEATLALVQVLKIINVANLQQEAATAQEVNHLEITHQIRVQNVAPTHHQTVTIRMKEEAVLEINWLNQ